MPVQGDLRYADNLVGALGDADGVIHTALASGDDVSTVERGFVGAVLDTLAGSGKPFIYTSGIWVLGNTGEQVADEESPLDPRPLVAWRPAIEQWLVQAATERNVRTVVIRPAMVYGRAGGLVGMLVQSGLDRGVVQFVSTGENRWPMVHVDDLARAYVSALEHAPAGTVLNVASGESVRLRELALLASRAAGVPGLVEAVPLEQARTMMGPFADALALDQQVSGARAKQQLGWTPVAPSVVEELEHGSYARPR